MDDRTIMSQLGEDIEEILANREAINGSGYVNALKFMHLSKQITMLLRNAYDVDIAESPITLVVSEQMHMFMRAVHFPMELSKQLIADCEMLMTRQIAAIDKLNDEVSKKNPGPKTGM